MIVVDSSAFIEYYRPSGITTAQDAVAEALAADQVAINGIIEVEIVAFAPSESAFQRLRSDMAAFHRLELRSEHFGTAAEIGFSLRLRGVTVPATDLIIAASALAADAEIYHLDTHFDRIAEQTELRARHLDGDDE